MSLRFSPTLRQVFALSLLGLLLSLALLFYLIFTRTERTILQSSERLRVLASQEVVTHVTDYLNEAPMAVAHFEKEITYGTIDPAKVDSIQAGLLSLLLSNENISEASFTYANSTGHDKDGFIQVDESSAGEVTVFKSGDQLQARRTWFDGKQFVATSNSLQTNLRKEPAAPQQNATAVADPTAHATFRTPAKKIFSGQLLWSDLHQSQLAEALPGVQKHLEVSVQQSINNSRSQFAGVLRVGLMKDEINRAVQLPGTAGNDPTLIFLCDKDGRLITGFGEGSRVVEYDDAFRIAQDGAPPQVKAALLLPALKNIDADHPLYATSFRSGSTNYLCTFRALPETQAWIAGIVVPRDFYLGELLKMRRQLLWVSLILIAAIVKVGTLILHSIGRAHSVVVSEASRMNAFEFSPSQNTSRLRDIKQVLASLEKAKTAMRAMGKYVPVDLVRRLYRDGREPVLGGESVDLSVLFTDIKGFTSFAEQTDPDKVAVILGRYLQVMASAIQGEKGTIDKFIGDSVMAFWNAPETVHDHAILTCRAALKCRAALRVLYDSPEWKGAPEFETRYGLHRCEAYVGHFGAPDRFNYTAIGDGINLASRLEGLNKHYGTAIIASESIYQAARGDFEFRLLDRVAVKGKAHGITIYELLGWRTNENARPPVIENYERAFAEFQRANFETALSLIDKETRDPPTLALAARCRLFIKNPPGADWNGIRVFESK